MRKFSQFSLLNEISEGSNNIVPQIAITAYESNEEDIEVTNLFTAANKKSNMIKK